MITRTRVPCIPQPTVYVDYVNGSDSNGGTSTIDALKTMQRAVDYAAYNFDLSPPFTWSEQGNVGYRDRVRVKIAPTTSAHAERWTVPVFTDGRLSSPILIQGATPAESAADPRAPLNYNLYAANTLQGITSQNGGDVLCEGFTIRGNGDCTLLNPLNGGKMAARNIWYGPSENGGWNCPIGAAGGSQFDLIGPNVLIGSGFFAVLSAIENGRIILAPGHAITFDNVMNFGVMVNMMYASCWTQGTPPVFNGTGLSGSTGSRYNAYHSAFIGFSQSLIPGSAGASDSTSYVVP